METRQAKRTAGWATLLGGHGRDVDKAGGGIPLSLWKIGGREMDWLQGTFEEGPIPRTHLFSGGPPPTWQPAAFRDPQIWEQNKITTLLASGSCCVGWW